MNTDTFEMVAKTFRGLEDVLAEELRAMGALNVEAGRRMVAFEGDKEMLYRANFGCRTALRILKPFYKFKAHTPDKLYDRIKEFDWSTLLTTDKTFAIDVTVNSEDFTNSRFVTYRVKDAIADWFRDRSTDGKRPGVRLADADVMLNVHISCSDVTVSLDSSGESLHKRGWRAAQTEAPINEVLAAGIILKSGWQGQAPLIDPMCGSGTFLIEAALIAANIAPGVYRKSFAFERWADFDQELFDKIYQDDSAEREVTCPILGGDLSPKAIAIATENIKSAGVSKYVSVECKPLSQWNEVPANGFMITNPPYGERLKPTDLDGLYGLLGEKLKHVFTGYHAWIIGYQDEHFAKIGLAPSSKEALLNGSLECELREYVIFDGDMRSFRRAGGAIKRERPEKEHGKTDKKGKFSGKGKFAGKGKGDKRKPFDRKPAAEEDKPAVAAPSSDNPLAGRRNPEALKYVIGRTPKLSARKGWRRKSSSSSDNENSNPEENN
jgi:putative N6-adenine-specific DNA methylase